jgi:putative toxin-antitoxin system antitoxin component (TIGR02293 family)
VTVVAEILADDLVDTADVARVVHTSPRSVVRWQGGALPRRESEERLLELKAVLDLARKYLSDATARRWLRTPVPDLDYEKPIDLVAQGEWRRVVDTLLAFAEGVTA